MRESTLRTLLNLLPVGRALGILLFGVGLGIGMTPSLLWGVAPAWGWKANSAICFGIFCFIVSIVAERRARRLLDEPHALDTPS